MKVMCFCLLRYRIDIFCLVSCSLLFSSQFSLASEPKELSSAQPLAEAMQKTPMRSNIPVKKDSFFSKIDDIKKARHALQNKKQPIDVIVYLQDEDNSIDFQQLQEQVASELTTADVRHFLQSTPALIMSIDETALRQLADMPEVTRVILDRDVKLSLSESRALIKADVVEYSLGVTGAGVGVCVIDTGVDYTHPAMQNVVKGVDVCAKSLPDRKCAFSDLDPRDEHGHGTHVAGIVASTDSSIRGIAPGAHIGAIKVYDGSGNSSISIIALGIDWCVANAEMYDFKVINMSFSAGYSGATCPTDLDPLMEAASNKGMTLVAAAGNGASHHGISYPACNENVISVSASYDSDYSEPLDWIGCVDSNPKTDQLACFSDRPADLVAPGSVIQSTASSIGNVGLCGATNPSGFGDCSGTSMASPHVAGVAALLYELNPSISPHEIKNTLQVTGLPLTDLLSQWTRPRIDAWEASSLKNAPFIELLQKPLVGQKVEFKISDPKQTNMSYLFLLSTGTSPGIQLPDGRSIPLNDDPLLQWSLLAPPELENSIGTLDEKGWAKVFFDIPESLFGAQTLYAAFITYDPNLAFPETIKSISSAFEIDLMPFEKYEIQNAVLPFPSSEHTCAKNSLNGNIVCFLVKDEGSHVYSSAIVEYDPIADSTTILNGEIPNHPTKTSCVTNPLEHKVYCFGGDSSTDSPLDQIVEYDLISQSATIKSAVLPSARYSLACVYLGEKIYCFGGDFYSQSLDEIIAYDPALDEVSIMNATLYKALHSMSCATSSITNQIYCMGGRDPNSIYTSTKGIQIYDPITDELVLSNLEMPYLVEQNHCTESPTSKDIICISGSNKQEIWAIDPITDSLSLRGLPATPGLRSSRCESSHGSIYCLGDHNYDPSMGLSRDYDTIIQYSDSFY